MKNQDSKKDLIQENTKTEHIKEVKLADIEKKLAGGVTNASPTGSLWCAYCEPKKRMPTHFLVLNFNLKLMSFFI